MNSVTSQYFINGISHEPTSTTYTAQHNAYTIGDNLARTAPFYGGISSLIVYSHILTDTERTKVEGYLAWKWWENGSILPSTHAYYNSPP